MSGEISPITSFQNPRVKELKKLRERRHRDETGLFLIEGFREISRAHQSAVEMVELFICEELFLGSNEWPLIEEIQSKKTAVFSLPKPLFEKISYRDRPDGLVAVARQKAKKDLEKFLQSLKNPFLLIAERIEKPGNLGSILRSADGAGVDGVILADPCTDLYNPNAVRSSIGTLFALNIFEAESDGLIALLKKMEIQIVAASPNAKEIYTEAKFKERVAVVVGSEQLGLSKKWMERADLCVSIPMKGIADSLNVSTAATLLIYEILRQRNDSL